MEVSMFEILEVSFGIEFVADYSGSGDDQYYVAIQNESTITSRTSEAWGEIDMYVSARMGVDKKEARKLWQDRLRVVEAQGRARAAAGEWAE